MQRQGIVCGTCGVTEKLRTLTRDLLPSGINLGEVDPHSSQDRRGAWHASPQVHNGEISLI